MYSRALLVGLVVGLVVVCASVVLLPTHAQDTATTGRHFLYHQKDSQGIVRVYATNNTPVPVFFRISTSLLTNYRPSESLPVVKVVGADQHDVEVLTFTPLNAGEASHVQYGYTAGLGDPVEVRHDDGYRYLFPYEHGHKYKVSQTHFGRRSHSDDQNRYAVDFEMPIGTPVHAARGGIVAQVKQDSSIGGLGARYIEAANYIRIAHEDGSFANYVHLRKNGAEVVVGQRVTPGQRIGSSGNTGNSSGPHLHFSVNVPSVEGVSTSIPMLFQGVDAVVEVPQTNTFYYSLHPGKPSFEVQLGSELVPENFDDYIRAVEQTNRIDIRDERVDSTVVFYISNGFAIDRTVEINVQSVGVDSALRYPLRLTVPAQSEIFCGLFYPLADAHRIRIAPSVRVLE